MKLTFYNLYYALAHPEIEYVIPYTRALNLGRPKPYTRLNNGAEKW